MTNSRLGIWVGVLVVALFISLFGNRNIPIVDASESRDAALFEELKVFTDVLSIVRRDYVREVNSRELIEGAIKGMLATLDPHSGYLDPNFYKDLQIQTRGEFGGLGIEITIKDGLLIVVAPMEGAPAARAGIKAGDAIVKIEGKFTKDYTLVDAVKQLRGPKGSPVTISILRKGQKGLIDVTVIRDNITVKSVRHRYLGDGFGYVRLSQFMESSSEDILNALAKMKGEVEKNELKGLILDLRNNPGGLLNQAIRVSDMFLSEGMIVYTDGRIENQRQQFFAHERDTEPEYPIIVLVNGGSASASEIVAGALKDHGRGLVLGTQTFGKGSVQTITPLKNGGALTLTTALYYTKSGRSIQLTGIQPDIDMPIAAADAEGEEAKTPTTVREGDLPGAIKNPDVGDGADTMRKLNNTPVIKQGSEDTPLDPMKADLETWLANDPQLQRALDLLKTFNIFGGTGTLPEQIKNLDS